MQDIKVGCWHQRGVGAACWLWEGAPVMIPTGLERSGGQPEAGGTPGAAEVGQETSHPHNIQPLPLSLCSLSHCLSLSGFPAHSGFQLWCFPGKPSCW